MDRAHELTELQLKKLERRIAREYKTAVSDMQKKLEEYLEENEEKRKIQEELLNAGKITKDDYRNWCYRHNMVGKRWENMLDTLTQDMHNANKIALRMTKEAMPDVYALNHNFGVYQIEHDGWIDTGLSLYNHDTAEYLLGDQRQLMPRPSTRKAAQIAANRDMQWNMKKIQSAVLQGVLQGESPYKVAERLRRVGQMNENASVRYARTMTTSAQNAGRYESFRRAKKIGVDLTIEWQATLDGRTRHDHRMMHGQRSDVDTPFHTPDGFTIYYPADCTGNSDAPQNEIWNCRCTLLSWVKGFEGDTVKESPKMGGKSFEEWQNEIGEDRTKFEKKQREWDAPPTMSKEKYGEWQKKESSEMQFEKAFKNRYGMSIQDAYYSIDKDPKTGRWLDEIGQKAQDTLMRPYETYGCGYVANADGSRAINKYLRSGNIGIYKKPEMEKTIDAINQLIEATTIKEDIVVDRWVHAGVLEKMGVNIGDHGKVYRIGHAFCIDGLDHEMIANNIRENLVGAIITDNGFMSASACSELNVFQGSDIKFSILTPKGTHAFITNNTRESEVVFSPGMKQKVKDVRIIEAEAFDHEHKPTKRKCIEILLELV